MSELTDAIKQVRGVTEALCEPLAIEDHVVQPADFVSPPKWHLAHTTWFFETFVVAKASPEHTPFDPTFGELFNSYYKSQGEPWQQSARGNLSRPRLNEVHAYRASIDEALRKIADGGAIGEMARLIELGLHHEQQHHEILVMDIKAILAINPSMPAYLETPLEAHPVLERGWIGLDGGIAILGVDHREGFSFDNERPRHEVAVAPFSMAACLETCGGWLEFIADDGYSRPELWLSDGWDAMTSSGWKAPRYWFERDGQWWNYTLRGARPIDPREPVSHVSYYEADAYARWRSARLPTEAQWQLAADSTSIEGRFLDGGDFAPRSVVGGHFAGMHGTLWQWTSSPYVAYPGYVQPAGALGEYNGKFMCNQMVLRGGCYATPRNHYRGTYRNFYRPHNRWQLAGLRLVRDNQ